MSFLFCYLHVWTDSMYKLCAIEVLKLNQLRFSRNSPGLSNIQSPRGTVTLSITAWINLVFIFVAKREREFNQFVLYFYRRQQSCSQGNIFTPVCHSVHGGCLPQCMLGYHIPPRADTPGSRHPRKQTAPRSRHPAGSRHPYRKQTPPPEQTPAYGQWAAGTHPTGMHSCYKIIFKRIDRTCRLLDKKIFGICSFLSSNWNSSMTN